LYNREGIIYQRKKNKEKQMKLKIPKKKVQKGRSTKDERLYGKKQEHVAFMHMFLFFT